MKNGANALMMRASHAKLFDTSNVNGKLSNTSSVWGREKGMGQVFGKRTVDVSSSQASLKRGFRGNYDSASLHASP